MRMRRRFALVGFGALALAASVYQLAFSERVVRSLIKEQLSAYLAAPCRIEHVRATFLGGLEVEGLTVLDPSAPHERALIEVDRAHLDFRLGLLGQGFRVTDLVLSDVRIAFDRMEDGTIPALRIIAPRTPATVAPGEEVPPPPPSVKIEGGTLVFRDHGLLAKDTSLRIDGIQGTLYAVRPTPASPAEEHVLTLVGRSNLLGGVTMEGRMATAPGESEVALAMTEIQIGPDLIRSLAPNLRDLVTDLRLEGTAALHAAATGRSWKDAAKVVRLTLRDVSASVALPNPPTADDPDGTLEPLSPIAVANAGGTLVFDGNSVHTDDLTFQALGATAAVAGDLEGVTGPAGQLGVRAALELRGLHIHKGLRGRLPEVAMQAVDAFALDAQTDLTATVQGPLAEPEVRASATVRNGRLTYVGYHDEAAGGRVGFDYVATGANGTVTFDGGLVKIDATARHDSARISVNGTMDHTGGDPSATSVVIDARDVPLDKALRDGFGDAAEDVFDPYDPSGVAARIRVHVLRDPEIDGEETFSDVLIELDDRATFAPEQLPTPLRTQTGTIRIENVPQADGGREQIVLLEGIAATGAGFSITSLDGASRGDDSDSYTVVATAEECSEALVDAARRSSSLSDAVKEEIAFVRPAGPLDFRLELMRSGAQRDDRVEITLRGTTIQGFAGIPLPATDLSGQLTFGTDRVDFDGVAGRVFGAPLRVAGHIEGEDLSRPHLDIHAEGLGIGPRLRTHLGSWGEKARAFFDQARPTDATTADLHVIARPDDAAEGPIWLQASRLTGPLRVLDLDFVCDGGDLVYDGDIVRGSAEGRVGEAELAASDLVLDTRTGALTTTVRCRGLHFPEHLAGPLSEEALPALARPAPGRVLHTDGVALAWEPSTQALSVTGPVSVRRRDVDRGTDPGLDYEGFLDLGPLTMTFGEDGSTTFGGRVFTRQASLDVGVRVTELSCAMDVTGRSGGDETRFALDVTNATARVNDRPVKDASFLVSFANGATTLDRLHGRAYGGALRGKVVAGGPKHSYRGNVTLEGARADRAFEVDPEKQLGGVLDLDVAFRNVSGLSEDLRGEGTLTIGNAELAKVPVVAAVLGPVQAGTFRTARVDFGIEGEWLRIQDAALESPLVTIRNGSGAVNMEDGRVDLTASVHFLLSGPLSWLWQAVAETLFRVRVDGTLRNPRPRAEYFTLLSRLFGSSLDENPEPPPTESDPPFGELPW